MGSDLTQAQAMRQDQFLSGFQTVFSRGHFFLSQFSPASDEQTRILRPQQLQLRERCAAHPLGLVGLQEIVVGTTDVEAARKPMQRVLTPREPERMFGVLSRGQRSTWRMRQRIVLSLTSLRFTKPALLATQRDDVLLLDTMALLRLGMYLTEYCLSCSIKYSPKRAAC